MESTYLRTLPQLDEANAYFWTGGADGRLRILRCQACGHWIHPVSPVCPACLSDAVEPEVVSGLATVMTYTVNYRAWGAGMAVPYVVAIVTLDEQPDLQLTTNIVGGDPEAVAIGMRVRVVFEQAEDVWLPMFEPA